MENLCGRPANSFFIAINACRIRPNAVNPVRNSRTRGWRRSSTHRPRAKSAISRSRQSVLFARQSRPYRFIRHRAGRSIAGPASSNRLTAATVPEPDQPYPPTYTLGLISGSSSACLRISQVTGAVSPSPITMYLAGNIIGSPSRQPK